MRETTTSGPGRARCAAAAVAAVAVLLAVQPAWTQTGAAQHGKVVDPDVDPGWDAGNGDGWTLDATPYLWATGIEGEVGIRGRTADVDLGFGDLIENSDGGITLAFEARKRRWGITTELILFKLSDQTGTPGPLFSGVEVSAEQTLIEVSPRYRIFEPDPIALDLIIGARIWALNETLRFSEGLLPTLLVEAGDQWTDPVFGLRAITPLGTRWLLQGRGDIGGFSVGSELTWQLLGVLGYRFSHSVSLRAGYRHLDVDFDNEEDGFLFDVGLGGWIAGATIAL